MAKSFEAFIQEFSGKHSLAPFNIRDKSGFWRLLLVKHSLKPNDLLISVVVSTGSDDTILSSLRTELVTSYPEGKEFNHLKLVSLSILASASQNGGYDYSDSVEHLYERTTYEERLDVFEGHPGSRFMVSPLAFF